ncbi:MAG: PD-(D/E)XK nuclease family protein [Candidatus Methanomethylophilaceae archaeon]|nr:PD-(D/E)XK nuclease family protein [Candidatus Methanomethylophilaceae archaeon]
MRCTKSIDELYEEVRDFDLVITTDAALATALNGRIDKPIVGPFAMTPKQIAGHVASRVMGVPLYSELKVISTVSSETDLSMKYVHSEIENIKEIRQYTKDVTKHLHTASSKAVYDSYEAIPTLERLMGAFIPEDDEFYKGINVAVIAEELFNDLDKHFIPISHESISIFKDEEYSIERIYEIGNDRQLAENAVDLIDPSKSTDYAIVLNTGGAIADAVRASLYRANIGFINALNVRDLSQIRDYLQFITMALEFSTIRVKHVKELFSNYNGFFNKGREEFLLCKQDESDMSEHAFELWNVMKNIGKMTYREVCDAICDRRVKVQVGILIEDLKVADTLIRPSNLNEVKYAVDNVKELHHNEEIPDNEKRGVLLVDCKNSVYIDRPVVIYLGMEQDWNISVVGKPYIDVEDETDKNVDRLNALLQQGNVRYYLVNSTKGGKPARPCMLFDLIYRKPIDSFSMMCRELVKGRWHKPVDELMPADPSKLGPADEGFASYFSKSSFNNYYCCPRKYLYGSFLTTPDEKSTEFGTLIHSFAEFYICYPEDVRELGLDHFVSMISERYSGLSSPMMEDLDVAKIKQAMSTVIEYIDHLGVKDAPLDVKLADKRHPNRFMEFLGKEYTSSICERDIRSEKYPVHGQLDLVWGGAITDYKTGKASTPADIANAMTFNSKVRYPEFQAPIYLSLIQQEIGNKGRFDLFYAMDNDTTAATGETPITSNVRSVIVHDKTLKEIIVSSKPLRAFLSDYLSKDLRQDVDGLMSVIQEMAGDDPAEWDKDAAMVAAINDRLNTKSKSTEPGLRKIASLVKGGILSYGSIIEMPQTELDSRMQKISEMHDLMIEQSKVEFPAQPRQKCKDCQYFSVCTKEIIDVGGDTDE